MQERKIERRKRKKLCESLRKKRSGTIDWINTVLKMRERKREEESENPQTI